MWHTRHRIPMLSSTCELLHPRAEAAWGLPCSLDIEKSQSCPCCPAALAQVVSCFVSQSPQLQKDTSKWLQTVWKILRAATEEPSAQCQSWKDPAVQVSICWKTISPTSTWNKFQRGETWQYSDKQRLVNEFFYGRSALNKCHGA